MFIDFSKYEMCIYYGTEGVASSSICLFLLIWTHDLVTAVAQIRCHFQASIRKVGEKTDDDDTVWW